MDSADNRTLGAWATIIAVAIVVIAGLFVAQQCSAQTAGEFTMTFSYGANVDAQMTEMRGADWIKSMKDELREHWQNRKSEAKEQYAKRRADVYNFEDASGLTKADQAKLEELYQKQKAWKEAEQRKADSLAQLAQPVGGIMLNTGYPVNDNMTANTPALAYPKVMVPLQMSEAEYIKMTGEKPKYADNIGKSYSPRMDFLNGASEVASNSFQTGGPTFGGIVSDLAVPVIIGLILIVFTIVAISQ